MPQPSNPFHIPATLRPHSVQKEVATTNAQQPAKKAPAGAAPSVSGTAQKRKASGGGAANPVPAKLPKTVPTTAAAAAQSVAVAAAANAAMEKKSKAKEAWDRKKKSKFIRAAAGETWEDESLLEWVGLNIKLVYLERSLSVLVERN